MKNKPRIPDLEIENAILMFKNFSGQPKKYTPEGKRTFNVVIPPENVDELVNQGWNVKPLKPLEEGDELIYTMKVNVSYEIVPPKIFMITESGHTPLTEETVGLLDVSDILTADLVISPSFWSMGNSNGISAYIKAAYITIKEDSFARKYGF